MVPHAQAPRTIVRRAVHTAEADAVITTMNAAHASPPMDVDGVGSGIPKAIRARPRKDGRAGAEVVPAAHPVTRTTRSAAGVSVAGAVRLVVIIAAGSATPADTPKRPGADGRIVEECSADSPQGIELPWGSRPARATEPGNNTIALVVQAND